MEVSRNLTPERGPSVWTHPPRSSPGWPMVALAAAAIGAGVAWRYRSLGKSLIMRGTGLGGVVLGFATSPAGRKVASLLMERWEAARQSADKVVDTAVDTALEDSFPASDPPALTARLTPR